jgi:signal transduction histidine kinase
MNNIAIIEMQNKNIENAISLHKNAITLFPNKILLPVFTTHLQNIANCYLDINRDSAVYYNKMALINAKANADSPVIASIYNNLGFLYFKKKNFTEALDLLLQSEALYNIFPDSTEQLVVYDNLAAVYDSTGQYKKAYTYLSKSNLYNEIKLDRDKIKISAELAEKYASEKKDEEIINQQKQNQLKTRNVQLSLLALALVALLGTVSFINYKRKQKANWQLQEQNNHILALNKELGSSNQVKTKLFSIISHDLRSPVSSLYAYLQLMQHAQELPSVQTTNAITRQTENLLETLEDLLMWSKSQLHQFTPEYVNLKLKNIIEEVLKLSATDIQNKKIEINNFINENSFVVTDGNMLMVILRNFLSNAVQNAIESSSISIYQESNDAGIVIRIENNTLQKEQEVLVKLNSEVISSKKYGLGKILIQEFAEKLNATISYQYKDKHIHAVLTLPHLPHP